MILVKYIDQVYLGQIMHLTGEFTKKIHRVIRLSGLNQIFIDANDFAKGMYLIVLDSEQVQIRQRLIIQ